MARSDATPFTVEVLEGPAAGAVVALDGRELPFRAGAGGSISFSKELRTKLTWYPGSRVASQQVIGPRIGPTTINGTWKERYLGEDRPIDLVELFEELLEMGSQVRVSWQTIVRQGVVKAFKWQPGLPVGGVGDIGWELTFEWSVAGIPTFIPRASSGTRSLRDQLVEGADAIANLIDELTSVAESSESFVGLVSRAFAPTTTAIEAVQAALAVPMTTQAQSAADSAIEPSLTAGTVEAGAAAANDAIGAAGEASSIMAGIFHGSASVDDSLEAVLLGRVARADANDAAFIVMDAQFDLQVRLEELARPSEFTRVPAVSGSDLRELARRFYGDSSLWTRIAKRNGLEGSRVPEGLDSILVPLSLPSSTDVRNGA